MRAYRCAAHPAGRPTTLRQGVPISHERKLTGHAVNVRLPSICGSRNMKFGVLTPTTVSADIQSSGRRWSRLMRKMANYRLHRTLNQQRFACWSGAGEAER